MFDRLAQLAQNRGRRVVLLAVLLSIVAGALGAGVADRLDPYEADDPDTESVRAADRLEDAGYREASVIVLVDGVERAEDLARRVAQDPDVTEVAGYHSTRSRDFVSRDGDSTYLAVRLSPTDDKELHDAGERIAEELEDEPGVVVGGSAIANRQANEQVESDLRTAELYAFPILFVLSLLFFRSLVAAALPLLVGGLTIVITMLGLTIASEVGSISLFALNLVIGLGLGLAIDYSLFVVSRYREEIAKTGPGIEALRRTMATAGRTVLFSALTVAGAIASLLVFPQNFLFSMGVGGSLTALIAALVSLTVLPAILALLGNRVNALSPAALRQRAEREAQPDEHGYWYRLSRLVMRVPGRIALASAAFLVALGLPFLGIQFTTVDPQVLPEQASAHRVDDAPARGLPSVPHDADPAGGRGRRRGGRAGGARGPRVSTARSTFGRRSSSRATEYVVEVISSSPALTSERRTSSQTCARSTAPRSRTARRRASWTSRTALPTTCRSCRDRDRGDHRGPVRVHGFADPAGQADPDEHARPERGVRHPRAGLPGRALRGPARLHEHGGLDATQPLFLFAVAFGLSTDYGVFLLSRIKEARDNGASNADAVAIGLERVGRIATAAAVLFAVAIGAFVTSEMVFIKELGLGTALAVLIDATIVRALLVPSLMEMLGRWNWWAPGRSADSTRGSASARADRPAA